MTNDLNSLAHTKWNCKYHIVFAPKYRRLVFYGEKKQAIGTILRKLCEWKGVEIHQAEACPSRSMSRPYPYVSKYTAKDLSVRFYGISKREK